MSAEIMVWASNQIWGSPLHRFVAMTIADVVSPFNDCIVSLDYISDCTEIDKDWVKEILIELQNRGSLRLMPTEIEGRYLIVFPECDDLCNPAIPISEKKKFKARVVEAFDKRCVHCEKIGDDEKGPDGRVWTLDRLLPGSKGGTYKLSNIALSCFACNVRRGNKPLKSAIESLEEKEVGRPPWRLRKRRFEKRKRQRIFNITESAVTRMR